MYFKQMINSFERSVDRLDFRIKSDILYENQRSQFLILIVLFQSLLYENNIGSIDFSNFHTNTLTIYCLTIIFQGYTTRHVPNYDDLVS